MTGARAHPFTGPRAAWVVGIAAAFVAAVDASRWLGPALLLDPERGWAPARLLLGLALCTVAAGAGALAAGAYARWARTASALDTLRPFPWSAGAIRNLAAAALAAGVLLRVAAWTQVRVPFLEDEVNLVGPALSLSGTSRDFADSIRPIPYGRADPHEMIGVAYLRVLRGSLHSLGATPRALRLPSLVGGVASLATAGLLARALLPAGGSALAVLTLAGLRWHLILSLSGWHSVLLVPLVDLATLGLLAARRRGAWAPALAGGAVLGIGAHLYLASWIAGAALLVFSAWPGEAGRRTAGTAARAAAFAAGFALVASPLFLFHEGRSRPYFGRSARHNVLREVGYQKSWLPAFEAAADALPAPWLIPDPEGRHDLEGASRLGWIVGIPVAVALARALRSPRQELSGLLVVQGAFGAAAAVASGTAGHPNGFRFGYLSSLTAVAASAGVLALVGAAPESRRRAGAALAVGLLVLSGAVGARQAYRDWPSRRATFDSFRGEDTLIGAAAARWDRYGAVSVATGLGRSDATIETVRRYGLWPDAVREEPPANGAPPRSFRIVRSADGGAGPATATGEPERVEPPGEHERVEPQGERERIVERIRDGFGREWAVVLGRRGAPAR